MFHFLHQPLYAIFAPKAFPVDDPRWYSWCLISVKHSQRLLGCTSRFCAERSLQESVRIQPHRMRSVAAKPQ